LHEKKHFFSFFFLISKNEKSIQFFLRSKNLQRHSKAPCKITYDDNPEEDMGSRKLSGSVRDHINPMLWIGDTDPSN